MTHEEAKAILEFGDALKDRLVSMAENNEYDHVGIYIAIVELQCRLLNVQTQETLRSVKESILGDPVKEAERIVRGE